MARIPPDEVIDRVRDLYREGLFVQAYTVARSFAPIREWEGATGRMAAASLARLLGAPHLGDALCRIAWSQHSGDLRVAVLYGIVMLNRRGPMWTIEFLDDVTGRVEGSLEDRAELHVLRAAALSGLRDFERAHRLIEDARAIDSSNESALLVRTRVLELEDRYDEALEQAQSVIDQFPGSVQAHQAASHLLQLLGRDREALDLLEDASQRFESGAIVMQLAAAYSELENHDAVPAILDRFEALSPMLEPEGRRELATVRADAAYACGDLDAAAAHMRLSRKPFHLRIASRLDASRDETPRRVLLDVGFVRQHHKTCVPATLAAVTAFWNRPAAHLELAETICYDGTSSHSERAWAEAQGWVTREFTVTWNAAVALLDRGVPFTLATRNGDSGHLQAVIGYDALRGTFLIRDPYFRHRGEAAVEPLLESQRHAGPRAMAMVPASHASRLVGPEYSDSEAYDRYFEFESALLAYDRRAAIARLEMLEAAGPHRLTSLARLSLANYDADAAAELAELDRWIERFPLDYGMRLRSFSCLQRLGLRSELARRLEAAVADPATPPLFWSEHASMVAGDPHRIEEALRRVRRAIRVEPSSARHLAVLGNILARRSRIESLEIYRLAACLADKDEDLAMLYFRAAGAAGRQEEGLAFLRTRFERLGRRSAGPGMSLAGALNGCERTTAAFEVVEKNLEAHPGDGKLLLVAADAYRSAGRFEATALLLDRAEGKATEVALLASRAALALASGERSAAREAWSTLASRNPHAVPAHESLAILDALEGGVGPALERLREACERAPHHVGLQQLQLKWLKHYRPDLVEPVLRRLLDALPHDAQLRLVLAIALTNQHRLDEAEQQLFTVLEHEPESGNARAALGHLRIRQGRVDEARKAFRDAIRSSVDQPEAICVLADKLAGRSAERRDVAAWVADELRSQGSAGDGLRAFASIAEAVLEPDAIRAVMVEVATKRQDAWAPRSALVAHDVEHGRLEAALDGALDASRRFPLYSGAWLDLADVRQRLDDRAGEIEALRHALRINPGHTEAVRRLARAHARAGQTLEALATLDAHPPTMPPDPAHQADAAAIAWSLGDREGALNRLRTAVRLQPGMASGWQQLAAWATELGRDIVEPLAREIAAKRPDDPMAWYALANGLTGAGRLDEQLAALDRACELSPWESGFYDSKARCLAEARRFDEALAACAPAVWADRVPLELRGRRVWVTYAKGRKRNSIDAMRELTREHPGYLWGWGCIADWTREAKDFQGYAEATGRMVEIDRSNASSHASRGDALLRTGERGDAKASLKTALKLDPTIEAAASLLFRAQLEDAEVEEAAATLDRGRPHLPPSWALVREVQLSCRHRQSTAALDAFRRLCLVATARWDDLGTAFSGMVDSSIGREAVDVLETTVADPEAPPFAFAFWVAVMAAHRQLQRCATRLREWTGREESWPLAAWRYVDEIREAGNVTLFHDFVDGHSDRLRADIRTWFAVLFTCDAWAETDRLRDWVSGWETRNDLEPWMWERVSLALRQLGADDDAHRATKRGLAAGEAAAPALRAWGAFDEMKRGNFDGAQHLLATIDSGALEPPERFVVDLSSAIGAMAPESETSGKRFAEARRLLAAAAWQHAEFSVSPVLRRAYRQTVERIAQLQGGCRGWAWQRYKWLTRAT